MISTLPLNIGTIHFVGIGDNTLVAVARNDLFVRQSGLSDPARYVFAGVTALLWALYLGLARPPVVRPRQLSTFGGRLGLLVAVGVGALLLGAGLASGVLTGVYAELVRSLRPAVTEGDAVNAAAAAGRSCPAAGRRRS